MEFLSLHIICKPTLGIQYKRKRSIDPSEIVEEPSAKKHKGFVGNVCTVALILSVGKTDQLLIRFVLICS